MFETFAKFSLAWPRRVRSARFIIAANDNMAAAPPARRPRQPLVCRWIPAGDGKRLACQWQVAAPPLPPLRQQGEPRGRPQQGRITARGCAVNGAKRGFT